MVQFIFTLIISFPLWLNAELKSTSELNTATETAFVNTDLYQRNEAVLYLKLAALESLILSMETANDMSQQLKRFDSGFVVQPLFNFVTSVGGAGVLYGFDRLVKHLTPEQSKWFAEYRSLKDQELKSMFSVADKKEALSHLRRTFGEDVAQRKVHFLDEALLEQVELKKRLNEHLKHRPDLAYKGGRALRSAARTTILFGGATLVLLSYQNISLIFIGVEEFEEKLKALKAERAELQQLLSSEVLQKN